MRKKTKNVLAVFGIGCLSTTILLISLVFLGINVVKDRFGSSDRELIHYVKDRYGVNVEIVSNTGRIPGSGGLMFEDARVRTLDKDQLEFDIHINLTNMITGDTYKQVKKKHDLYEKYRSSDIFQKLKTIGFKDIEFGIEADDPPLSLSLPDGMDLADTRNFAMLFEALPLLKQLKEETAKEENYVLNRVSIDAAILDLNKQYKSSEDLGNQLAVSNVEEFSYQFDGISEQELKKIKPQLLNYGFSKNGMLECYKMVNYHDCHSYALTVQANSEDDSISSLRYDRVKDKKIILKAIHQARELKIPVKKIIINSIYVPNKPEYQYESESKLKEQYEDVHFYYTKVEIRDLDTIDKIEDIKFFY
ncbi:hypothetical protein [Rummeliibacillus pycnus]|uniref:hypothetical protein n=1 Tax=Rummeliibacillus pycnus TaxID=101070 RepID=UPI0037C96E5D